eukprot:RCo017300
MQHLVIRTIPLPHSQLFGAANARFHLQIHTCPASPRLDALGVAPPQAPPFTPSVALSPLRPPPSTATSAGASPWATCSSSSSSNVAAAAAGAVPHSGSASVRGAFPAPQPSPEPAAYPSASSGGVPFSSAASSTAVPVHGEVDETPAKRRRASGNGLDTHGPVLANPWEAPDHVSASLRTSAHAPAGMEEAPWNFPWESSVGQVESQFVSMVDLEEGDGELMEVGIASRPSSSSRPAEELHHTISLSPPHAYQFADEPEMLTGREHYLQGYLEPSPSPPRD